MATYPMAKNWTGAICQPQGKRTLSAMGAMRMTPSHAKPRQPLHISIQDYYELYKKLESDQIIGIPSDKIFPKYSFQKPYKVSMSDREAWNERHPIPTEITWYTDGLQNK